MKAWKVLLMSALLVGTTACGDDDGTTTDTGPGPADGGADTTPPDDAEVPGDTIADIAAGNPDFSILVELATRVGLVDTLASAGPLTVFAPQNGAFDGIDTAALSDAQVTQILANHVIVGAAVGSDAIPPTADNAADLTLIFGTEGGVTVNGATVTMPDIAASNGIIHIVDSVIMPANIADLAGYAGLTSLAEALVAADLLGAVQDPEAELTVFAPTNAAFETAGVVPAEAPANVLLYHVVDGAVDSASVPALAPTLASNSFDNNLTLLFNTEDGVTINGGPSVALADVKATNGIVHVIDGVLLPMNVVDAATAAGLTGLLGAVGAAADIDASTTVAAALAADASYTVLAPTNEAFEAIADTVAGLTPEQIRDVLLYHVIDTGAPVLAEDLPEGDVETLNGADVTFDPAGPTVNGEAIAITDINVTNGVVHIIGGVLLPPG